MLRLEIRKYQCVEFDGAMPVLPSALGRHFEDRERALCSYRSAQESLDERSSRHRPAHVVRSGYVAHFDADRIQERRGVSRFFEYRVDVFGRRRFSFRAGDADDEEFARGMAVPKSPEVRQREMIEGQEHSGCYLQQHFLKTIDRKSVV